MIVKPTKSDAIRGQETFNRFVRPFLTKDDDGKYVAVDLDTGEYEIDEDDFTATERILLRKPDANLWLFCVGEPATYRIGFSG